MRATVAALLAWLACATALPAALLPGEAGGATFLDCTLAANDPLYPYRCRPVRYMVRSSITRQDGQSSEEEEAGPGPDPGVVSLALTVPKQVSLLTPNCHPHQVYIPNLNVCQDMTPYRSPTQVMTSLGHLILPRANYEDKCPTGTIMTEPNVCLPIDPKEPIREAITNFDKVQNKEKNKDKKD